MQVFVIHGGEAFSTYEEYFENLKQKEIDLEKFKIRGWKSTLEEKLGEGYEVVAPRMPNAQNAKYAEWKIWFEKFIPFVHDGVILIGHSLGGVFLAKYLAENNFPKKIRATFLVAPPFDTDLGRPLEEFVPPISFTKLAAQGSEIHFYHSKDDPVVPYMELAKYRKRLPNAKAHVFEDRQHFNQEEFPEIVADIKKL